MSHIEIVDCDRKDCKHNRWDIIRQFHCTITILKIVKGKCTNYECALLSREAKNETIKRQ